MSTHIWQLFSKKCHFQIISDVQWWTKKFHPFLHSTHQECMFFAKIENGPCYYLWNEICAGVVSVFYDWLLVFSSKSIEKKERKDAEFLLVNTRWTRLFEFFWDSKKSLSLLYWVHIWQCLLKGTAINFAQNKTPERGPMALEGLSLKSC